MNQRLIPLIGALAIGAALPALAGPDWQVIEQARKAKQATQDLRQGGRCTPDELVLALDHGPRAQTTPHQNRQREQGHVRSCA
jgi:hypothetical protein